ncbi:MAG TPA: DNA-directed RNA polymerase subunit alpha [Chloroflexia bacterium]|nr:DNA-directed RNA polymerase subunit alpha [Chloroflexia bacterium]
MADLLMPRVEVVATAPNYRRFALGPLEKGYGLILGNALRRILLSSLPGAAITSVRIEGVYHEFSTLPHVKEDVTEIILNIKKLRLRSFSDRPVRLQLSATGPGRVRASDIQLPSTVELINDDQVLATLDSNEGRLEMELMVERGRGYISSDAREGMPIGTIPVDAVFSPIPRVNYVSEPMDSEPNAEQLILEIWSDGTMDVGEALSLAAAVLAQHSTLLANYSTPGTADGASASGAGDVPEHLAEMPIEELGLSVRTFNCLKRSGITRVGQILQMDRKSLLGVRNFGQKSFDELQDALAARGLSQPGGDLEGEAFPAEDVEDEDELLYPEEEGFELAPGQTSFTAAPEDDEPAL